MRANRGQVLGAAVIFAVFHVQAASAQTTRNPAAVTYFLTKPLIAGTTPIGDMWVCAELDYSASPQPMISVQVAMPDSQQIISVFAPFHTNASGDIAFAFDDDAWGNGGVGTLRTTGDKAVLDLKHTKSTPHATKNVLRNYGTFTLSKRSCD
jgi:hypothetical protein